MKVTITIETKETRDGFVADVEVEGMGSDTNIFSTKPKENDDAALKAALHTVRHIYL